MKKLIGLKTIKSAIGATLSILIANGLGLSYAASAGIITILSIQNTRKESVEIALRRMVATVMALFIGSALLMVFGYRAVVFGVYLLVFIPLTVKCHVTEGIVPASVLVTHLLGSEGITETLLINELELMLVGVAIALLLNVYMPSLEEKLSEEREKVDEAFFSILMEMREVLNKKKEKLKVEALLTELEEALSKGRKQAEQYNNNYFFNEKTLIEKYLDMRYSQYQILLYLVQHFEHIFMLPTQAGEIARLTEEVALTMKGKASVEEAMHTLEHIRQIFKQSELPKTRDEFENRAMLYQFLTDIEQLLMVKKYFKSQLNDKETREYVTYYH